MAAEPVHLNKIMDVETPSVAAEPAILDEIMDVETLTRWVHLDKFMDFETPSVAARDLSVLGVNHGGPIGGR